MYVFLPGNDQPEMFVIHGPFTSGRLAVQD
jgi:hypothetical protein